MNLRPFGTTGMWVSEIGLGAWQLANPDWNIEDRAEALQIVRQSLHAGCNFFDTAPGYGYGRNEELLGEGLKDVRQDVIICTKFSHHDEHGDDFESEHIRPVLEGSLRRLQTEYVDILLLHNPPRELMDGRTASQYEELEKLKTEGKIREYGVSLDWRVELEMVVETTKSNAVELMYNVFYQEPRGAFSMAHAALQYILAQPAISTIIPGAKTVEQALDNFAAANNRLPADVVRAIDALWERELKGNPLPW